MHRISHDNPPDFCRETTGGARDGLVHPGSGIARMGDRASGGGGNDFVRYRMQSGGGQNGGAPLSLRREAQGHHAGRTVSKDPPPPPQYRTPAGCELPFLHPDDAGMKTTGEQI